MARTTIGAVNLPTMNMINHLKKLPAIISMRYVELIMNEELLRFQLLFETQSDFKAKYSAFSPCFEAIVLSKIFNPDLDVQDNLRQK